MDRKMSKLADKINDAIAQQKTIELEINGSNYNIQGNSNARIIVGKGCEYLEEIQPNSTIKLYNLAKMTTIRIS